MTYLPAAVIVDVDGTLTIRRFGGASPDVYRPAIYDPDGRTPYCWHRVGEDPPNPAMVELAGWLHASGLAVIVTSGRSEVCRVETEEWLRRHGVPWTELHMATAAETSGGVPDSEVKRRIYAEAIEPRYRVLTAFDDRDQVVAVWRSLGILCAQVGDGRF